MKRWPLVAVFSILLAGGAAAPAQTAGNIETKTIEYREGGVTFHGYLARPTGPIPAALADGDDDDRPGVLVVHEWWGLNDFTKKQAEKLAELGYVVFAVDMFGEGRTTTDAEVAKSLAGPMYQDRATMRKRVQAGLDVLDDLENVDDDRLAVVGYCFGGTVALELAYAEGRDEDDDDMDLRGVVSFHGNPMPPMADDRNVPTRVVFFHGEDDPMVERSDLDAVVAAINGRKGRAQLVTYPGAQHSFTNPGADKFGLEGAAYNEDADRASWQAAQAFLLEVLRDDD